MANLCTQVQSISIYLYVKSIEQKNVTKVNRRFRIKKSAVLENTIITVLFVVWFKNLNIVHLKTFILLVTLVTRAINLDSNFRVGRMKMKSVA